MTIPEFELLRDTHEKVDRLAEAFARHVAVEEDHYRIRCSRAPTVAAVASLIAAGVALSTLIWR